MRYTKSLIRMKFWNYSGRALARLAEYTTHLATKIADLAIKAHEKRRSAQLSLMWAGLNKKYKGWG